MFDVLTALSDGTAFDNALKTGTPISARCFTDFYYMRRVWACNKAMHKNDKPQVD